MARVPYQYAANVTGPAATRLYVWFEPDLLPGYAWSFPLPDGRANIGYGVLRDGTRTGADLREVWGSPWDRPHIAVALGPGSSWRGGTPHGRSRPESTGPR